MERQDVENIINQNIKDNTTRDITPDKVRDALSSILDWIDSINVSNGGSIVMLSSGINTKYSLTDSQMVEKITVIPSNSLSGFGVGTQNGVSDILPGLPVEANEANVFLLDIYANGSRDIWFNGITAQTTIKIYLR